ncbi:MAG: hypothetical protein NT077_01655, partial [Candidatus Taylorbacteria bacterium]|nr:hypothetical protein [Candidatus Taylorbacteria bacterium]
RALHIEQRRLEEKHRRYGHGPIINRVELVYQPAMPGDKTVFEIDVLESGITRTTKLRFEATNGRRRSVEQFRGKRDLRLMIIFIRLRDHFGQILTRISKRIGLVIADIRRQIDYWRRTDHTEPMPPYAERKWRRRRRHWCHRARYEPPMITAYC